MKRIILVLVVVFVGALGWRVGGSMSSDALSMAVGVLFGALAGIPAALLVMSGARRQEQQREAERAEREGYAPERRRPDRVSYMQPGYDHPTYGPNYAGHAYPPPQPPVIVLAGPQAMNGQPQHALPAPNAWQEPVARAPRQFKVMGGEETLDEW